MVSLFFSLSPPDNIIITEIQQKVKYLILIFKYLILVEMQLMGKILQKVFLEAACQPKITYPAGGYVPASAYPAHCVNAA